jgi:hypothetical protein
MGQGDDALGEKLLVSFLKNLAASETVIHMEGCVNDAVFLTTQAGEALDALRVLESKGATIASCGTCLDHHGLREALKIGVVGNMPGTIEILSTADKVIAPC